MQEKASSNSTSQRTILETRRAGFLNEPTRTYCKVLHWVQNINRTLNMSMVSVLRLVHTSLLFLTRARMACVAPLDLVDTLVTLTEKRSLARPLATTLG